MNGPVAISRLPGTGEGVRFNGDNAAVIADWAGPDATYDGGRLVIHTPQGAMTPNLGDWIINADDEFYPVTTKAFTRGWQVID